MKVQLKHNDKRYKLVSIDSDMVDETVTLEFQEVEPEPDWEAIARTVVQTVFLTGLLGGPSRMFALARKKKKKDRRKRCNHPKPEACIWSDGP